jgi:hypothetical protein
MRSMDNAFVSDDEKEKAVLEIERLRSEVVKARIDARFASRGPKLELLKIVLTSITALVALGGLFATMLTQQGQARQTEIHRRDDSVADLSEQFSTGATPRARLGALAGLASYGSDARHRPAIRRLLLESLPLERDEEVRTAMMRAAVALADSALLAELADYNRRKSLLLRSVVDTVHGRLAVVSDTASVSRQSQSLEDLWWYATTLIEAINTIKVVRGQDFSHNTFYVPPSSLVSWTETLGRNAYLKNSVAISPRFTSGLHFENVKFDYAILQWQYFKNASFKNTTFDDAQLRGTGFSHCRMEAVSLRTVTIRDRSWAGIPNSVYFNDCDLDVTEFSVRDPRLLDEDFDRPVNIAAFRRSMWRIQARRPTGWSVADGRAVWNVPSGMNRDTAWMEISFPP